MATFLERDQILIDKLIKIVQSNLSNENFAIMDLSNAAGMNHRIIRKRLKQITGKTINQFIREVRLRNAMEMLLNEDVTASEVAFKTGFGSPAYFNTCFHEFFGIPPGEVKKRGLNHPGEDFLQKQKLPMSNSEGKPRKHIMKQYNKPIKYLSGFIVFASIVLALLQLFSDKIIPEKKKEISIAVLPFKNLSSNSDDQYLIDGIMEEILTNLSRIHELRVVSRTSVEPYRNIALSANDISKKLRVDYLIEGSGQKYGDNFLLRVQLIDTHKDSHLWAETYEREIRETGDIIDIQSEVSRSIASKLKINISPNERHLIEKIPTTNLTALDFYHRGVSELLNKRIDRAELLFKKALKLDSTFLFAYSGLFMVYKDRHYYSAYYSEDYQDSLLILTKKSLSLDKNYWPAYLGRAEYYNLTGKHSEVIKECNRSLAINPDYWVTHRLLAETYMWNNYLADYPKALEHFQKAAESERGEELPELIYWIGNLYGNFAGYPDMAEKYFNEAFNLQNDSINYFNRSAYFEMVSGNFDKAVDLALKSNSINLKNKESLRVLGLSFLIKRKYRESLTYFKEYAEILKANGELQTSTMVPIGLTYLRNGYKEEAQKWFNEQKEFSEVSLKYGRWYSAWGFADLDLGIMYSLMGEKQKAYEYLQKFAKINVCPLFLITDMKYSPIYDSLRNDAEFQLIFADMESKYRSEHDRVKKYTEKVKSKIHY